MYTYIYPLFLLTHSLLHKLIQTIMHTHVHREMILAKCGEQILGGPEDRGRIALRWYRIRLDPDPDALWSDSKIEEDLNVGSRVKLRGLVKKTTLNGRVGTVADLDYRKSGNLAIRLDACSWDRSP